MSRIIFMLVNFRTKDGLEGFITLINEIIVVVVRCVELYGEDM